MRGDALSAWLPRPHYWGQCRFQTGYKKTNEKSKFFKNSFCMFSSVARTYKMIYKTFSICNIKGAEKFSWSLPVHLFYESLSKVRKCYNKHLDDLHHNIYVLKALVLSYFKFFFDIWDSCFSKCEGQKNLYWYSWILTYMFSFWVTI